MMPGPDRRLVPVALVVAVLLTGVFLVASHTGAGQRPHLVLVPHSFPRNLDAYGGAGAWIDAYDYAPAYQTAGHAPPLKPSVVAHLARAGVRTLFIQAARADSRSPNGIVNQRLLTRFLVEAHLFGVRVV